MLSKVYFKPKFPNDSNLESCSMKQSIIRLHPNSPPPQKKIWLMSPDKFLYNQNFSFDVIVCVNLYVLDGDDCCVSHN